MASTTITERKTHRYLLTSTLATTTQKKYKDAVYDFITWAIENNDDATTTDELDDLLMDYIHDLHGTGKGSRSKAACTVYGIITYVPSLKDKLTGAKRCLKGWNKLTKGRSYPPLTWHLALVIALQLARRNHYDMGVGLLLAFDCFLRVSELVNIRRFDIADDGDPRISKKRHGMLLRLSKTKTGANQHVLVLNENVQTLVRGLVKNMKLKDKVFNFTADKFRRTMKGVCSELGLSPLYVPHSLRHGGATHYHHVLSMSMEDVLKRGRWVSMESARRYVQTGVAVLMDYEIPGHIKELADDLDTYDNIIKYLALTQQH